MTLVSGDHGTSATYDYISVSHLRRWLSYMYIMRRFVGTTMPHMFYSFIQATGLPQVPGLGQHSDKIQC